MYFSSQQEWLDSEKMQNDPTISSSFLFKHIRLDAD